jgi:ElaB/YqjD/DUF883 family membrane-anchored ribosome-binding protein
MNSNAKLMKTVAQIIRPAGKAGRTAARVGEKVQPALDAAMTSPHDGRERVRKTARHTAANADEYVHSNPWSAIGIAVATGAAIAAVLSARMHR